MSDLIVKRPRGISILSLLCVFGGLGALLGLTLTPGPELASVTHLQLQIAAVFLATLSLSAAFGSWKGKTWGFWCLALAMAYTVFQSTYALTMIQDLAVQHNASAEQTAPHLVKHVLRILVHIWVLFYLFRNKRVAAFFGREKPSEIRQVL